MSETKPPTGGSDRDDPNDDGRPIRPKVDHAELTSAALIEAMRAGHARAVDEFIVRHQRLLFERARMAGLRRADCEEHIVNVVEDIAMLIVARRIRPTRGLEAYVVRSFFNRVSDDAAERRRRRRVVRDGSEDAPGRNESAVLGAISEHSVRASHGPDWEDVPLSAPLRKLASMIEEGLSAEEEQLLAWHSKYVPLREIAAWLGLAYATAAQRSWRLRQRLRDTATQYAATFSRAEWREIAAFLDRCAVAYDRTSRQNPDADSPPHTA